MSPARGVRHVASVPAMRKVKLSTRHERLVYLCAGLLALSGVVWLVAHYFFRQHSDFGDLPSPAEAWCLRVHGAAVIFFLVALGSLFPNHVHRAWQTRRNLRSGISLLTICCLLTLTGYGLYYVAADELRPVISVLHWGIGLASILALPVHVVLGRRKLIS